MKIHTSAEPVTPRFFIPTQIEAKAKAKKVDATTERVLSSGKKEAALLAYEADRSLHESKNALAYHYVHVYSYTREITCKNRDLTKTLDNKLRTKGEDSYIRKPCF